MTPAMPDRSRVWLVPEVIQTSLMDCGPAALKAVLQGFGIAINYDTLRERCQTDVDGTSIDALAGLGRELGLESHEILVPRDHFLLPEADCLPAIVVTRSGGGLLHFLVVWKTVGPYVQILDPGGGRRWVRRERFLATMPDLPIPISIERWRRWMSSENALAPLRARMRAAGIRDSAARALIASAEADAGWHRFAALDAGVRMLATLIDSDAISKGAEGQRLVESLIERTVAPQADPHDSIPRRFWWASPGDTRDKLTIRGAVIVHFEGRTRATSPSGPVARDHGPPSEVLPASFKRELASADLEPLRLVEQMIRLDSPRALPLLAMTLAASVVVTTIDAFLLRGVLDVSRYLSLDYQRVGGIVALLAFCAGGLLLEMFIAAVVHRLGLGLETRLRVGFLEKLPRLEDRYLRSRPTSDMTARGHAMQILREAPALGVRIARASLTLLATVVGLIWLYPRGGAWAVTAGLVAFVVPYLLQRPLVESSMRMRTHAGALERFYLDALLGVVPIRVHGAERAVRREHEDLLVEWARTARAMHLQSTGLQGLQMLASTSIAVALVANYVGGQGAITGVLLLAFWALRVPAAGQELVVSLVAYRNVRNVAMRLFAPLGAAEVAMFPSPAKDGARGSLEKRGGVGVRFRGVAACVSGHTILRDLSADIPAGQHVAIVGASGAGKSSLVGLLLGWLAPSGGRIEIDGANLDSGRLAGLREEIAWVDPAVHLWHRSLLENVVFGEDADSVERLPEAMARADLTEVLENLPEGMQANLGEGGVRVSGGQGQRVRLARALMRKNARLVILDEPFRGLERERRRELLRRLRAQWRDATILFVSHDVGDTGELDRVLVLDKGTIVEDGPPGALLANPESSYRALVLADRALREGTWSGVRWRRHLIERGQLSEARAT